MCSRVAQEVQLEKQEKKAKKLASVAAKLAAGNVENVPVQPVFPVPAGLQWWQRDGFELRVDSLRAKRSL